MSGLNELIEILQQAYALRALLASILVGITCGLLGVFIVLRNMSLIGDALSHAILPGVVAGFLIAGHSLIAFFTGSVVAGLLAATAITWLQRKVKAREDAAIGIIFSAMFALGIIGISAVTRKQGVHLDMKDFLFGNVLGIGNDDLWLGGLIALYTVACILLFYRFFFITTFQAVTAQTSGIRVDWMHYFMMLLLSFAVVASLQSVGVVLVVAMLIIPASTALQLSKRLPVVLFLSATTGIISAGGGLILSIIMEFPPGPTMTLLAFILYLSAILFSPEHGLIPQFLRGRRRRHTRQLEDILKLIVRLQEREEFDTQTLAERLNQREKAIIGQLNSLKKRGWMRQGEGKSWRLTDAGLERAYELIRAHRLWESYLWREMGLSEGQLHAQAERYEHSLPQGFIDAVDARLGYPLTDPHGSSIPQRESVIDIEPVDKSFILLTELEIGEAGMILSAQPDEGVRLTLWDAGISAGQPFVRAPSNSPEVLCLQSNRGTFVLPPSLADRVRVRRIIP
jgi:ABC-type Mn2+/Zn2+ transport system permease subunit/Mn-dependent DtxR family transcriptional regulator